MYRKEQDLYCKLLLLKTMIFNTQLYLMSCKLPGHRIGLGFMNCKQSYLNISCLFFKPQGEFWSYFMHKSMDLNFKLHPKDLSPL